VGGVGLFWGGIAAELSAAFVGDAEVLPALLE
jgi:hypothetical protein